MELAQLKRQVAESRAALRRDPRAPVVRQNLAHYLCLLAEAQLAAGDCRAVLLSASEALPVLRAILADPAEAEHHSAQRRLLASAGTVIGWAHSDLGEHAEGLAVCRDTLATLRAGDVTNENVLDGIVVCLDVASTLYFRLGDHTQGLRTLTEATQPLKTLARTVPEKYTSELVDHLLRVTGHYMNIGYMEQALERVTEALRICRANVHAQPGVFEPLLGRALCDAGMLRRRRGEWDRGLALLEECVQLWKRMLRTQPSVVDHYAQALDTLAGLQADLGQLDAAIAAGEEALALYRTIAKRDPKHLPALAQTLQTLAARFNRVDSADPARAEAYVVESIALMRAIIKRGGEALFFHTRSLGRSLGTLATTYSNQGRVVEAATAMREAVALFRQVARDHPELAANDLASALLEVASIEEMAGNLEAALDAALEGTAALEKLRTGALALAQLPQYSTGLCVLAKVQAGLGRYADALKSSCAAAKACLDLLERAPGGSTENVSFVMKTAWFCACALDDTASLAAVIELFRRIGALSAARPDAFAKLHIALLEAVSDGLHCLRTTSAAIPAAEFFVKALRASAELIPAHRARAASALAVLGLRQQAAGKARAAAASFSEAVEYLS